MQSSKHLHAMGIPQARHLAVLARAGLETAASAEARAQANLSAEPAPALHECVKSRRLA